MSKLWGPLGWMTLHSVSLIYPETPTSAEKAIAARFLELFENTISCIYCKVHFIQMKSIYKSVNPDYLDSRQKFALFIFRAHNTVNKRLDKPLQRTVNDCLSALRQTTAQTSLGQFRTAYLSYLMRNWGRDMSGEGLMLKQNVKEMVKINNEYWSPRDIPIPYLEEDDVLLFIERTDLRIAPSGVVSNISVGFKGGKLRLGKR
jgi:hypothetical protein